MSEQELSSLDDFSSWQGIFDRDPEAAMVSPRGRVVGSNNNFVGRNPSDADCSVDHLLKIPDLKVRGDHKDVVEPDFSSEVFLK